jgi:hypothetical protein
MKPCTDNWAMEGLQKEMVELKAAFGTFYWKKKIGWK